MSQAITLNTNILNQIKNLFVAFANERGIDLTKEFKTSADFVAYITAFTFQFCVKQLGMTSDAALDLVIGQESINRLGEQIWEQVNNA